jgi:hypothetical protein
MSYEGLQQARAQRVEKEAPKWLKAKEDDPKSQQQKQKELLRAGKNVVGSARRLHLRQMSWSRRPR